VHADVQRIPQKQLLVTFHHYQALPLLRPVKFSPETQAYLNSKQITHCTFQTEKQE
jgi:hypothetical protein